MIQHLDVILANDVNFIDRHPASVDVQSTEIALDPAGVVRDLTVVIGAVEIGRAAVEGTGKQSTRLYIALLVLPRFKCILDLPPRIDHDDQEARNSVT